ncbi:MAG: 5'-deoxynucleotidase [Clostridia bacterium]
MGSSFFAFISRMKYINRWGLMRNTNTENLKEHSFDVALISHALALISNEKFGNNLNGDAIAVQALYHDCSEIITGDLPTPIKYFSKEINVAYNKIEELAKEKILLKLPCEFRNSYKEILNYEYLYENNKKIIKAADTISAYIKCLEEEKSGNLEFHEARIMTYKKLQGMKMREVDYFLKEFIDAYSQSLDLQ